MMSNDEFAQIIDGAFDRYKGNMDVVESAIGALAIGRRLGWRPLFIIHQRSTIRRYEKILGIKFRDKLPEVGVKADKSLAWKIAKTLSNYWKAVRGDISGIRTPVLE
ncbi:conserved hypothetical protein [Rhodospirillaceae bacterium LM-1]|nr:conserved hypothetical protein [Rhodospirillaceae bacterium LM-1]